MDLSIAGGGVAQPPPAAGQPPASMRRHQRTGTAEGYRARALADGIAPRPSGLFPPGDALLLELAASGARPFEKHLPGAASPYEPLPAGGWATGDAAAARGLDLRLFYAPPASGELAGRLTGAARFGAGASIGAGFYGGYSAHGGAVETVLDEATAELAKMEWQPFLSTVEAKFRIRRPVPLHASLRVECALRERRGVRCWVEGTLSGPGGEVLATCEAQLVNMTHFLPPDDE